MYSTLNVLSPVLCCAARLRANSVHELSKAFLGAGLDFRLQARRSYIRSFVQLSSRSDEYCTARVAHARAALSGPHARRSEVRRDRHGAPVPSGGRVRSGVPRNGARVARLRCSLPP